MVSRPKPSVCFRFLRWKADAVILDRHGHVILFEMKLDGNPGWFGMTHGVIERFLGNAEKFMFSKRIEPPMWALYFRFAVEKVFDRGPLEKLLYGTDQAPLKGMRGAQREG